MHGFIKLREEIPILKDLIDVFKSQKNVRNGLNYIDLSLLFSSHISKYYRLFGKEIFMHTNQDDNTVTFLEKNKIAGLVIPMGMATFTKRKLSKLKDIVKICETRQTNEKVIGELSFVNLLEYFFDEKGKAKYKQEQIFEYPFNGTVIPLKSNKELFTMGKLKKLVKDGEATLIIEKFGVMYQYYIYYRFKDGTLLLTTPYTNRIVPFKRERKQTT